MKEKQKKGVLLTGERVCRGASPDLLFTTVDDLEVQEILLGRDLPPGIDIACLNLRNLYIVNILENKRT